VYFFTLYCKFLSAGVVFHMTVKCRHHVDIELDQMDSEYMSSLESTVWYSSDSR